MSQTYELTTIKDIFDKVPSDRIVLCCQELGAALGKYKELAEAIPEAELEPEFPLKWIDDNKGEVTALIHESKPDGSLGDEIAKFTVSVGGVQ